MSTLGRVGLILAVAVAVGIQFLPLGNIIKTLQLGFGIGKTIQPLADFPYQCRRLEHPLLQACEDMFFSEPTRQLYLACSESEARLRWFPAVAHYNLTGRSHNEGIVIVDADQPALTGSSGPVVARKLKMPDFTGTAGDGLLSLTGFTGVDLDDGGLRLFVVNNQPSLDPTTGAYAEDQASVGVNATIELFERAAGDDPENPSLKHLKTFADPKIATPNRVAVYGSGGFYITNDHGNVKTGELARFAAMLMGKGDVAFCSYKDGCSTVSTGHHFPNGLHLHSDGRLYVPSSALGGVQVYQPQKNGSLEKLADIEVPYAVDNLSEDQNGDIFASTSPRGLKLLLHSKNPLSQPPSPATVIRIRKTADAAGGYTTEKILEDGQAAVLPGATTVIHDARTGRLFLSGVSTPFIAVCDPK